MSRRGAHRGRDRFRVGGVRGHEPGAGPSARSACPPSPRSRPVITTRAPSARKRPATARPRPVVPPVISARFPSSKPMAAHLGSWQTGQMADFTREDLTGSRFEQVDLTGARFRNVDLTGAVIRGALLVNMDIDGEISDVRINGVDVVPLVEAELDRRYPDRAKMRPADADGFRQAWDILERLWQQTVARARGLDPDLLHERVDGEWSFIETLRHLVFATDAWVSRAILGQPSPWDPLGLPHDEMPDDAGVPRDPAPARRWTRCSPCAPTAWPPCARCSPGSPTPSWPG